MGFFPSFYVTDHPLVHVYMHTIIKWLVLLQTKIEIVVTEGDQEGDRLVAVVREIGASALVVGLHDQSFLYK